MSTNKNLLILLVFSVLYTLVGHAQEDEWKKVSKDEQVSQVPVFITLENLPTNFHLFSLDTRLLTNKLQRKTSSKSSNSFIKLPNSEGVLETFKVEETSNFEPQLAAKYPTIKSFTAKSLEDKSTFARLSLGTDGFHAVIYSSNKPSVYIDPYTKDKQKYIVYKSTDFISEQDTFQCKTAETATQLVQKNTSTFNANDGKLRTFRLAVACSGEYAQFHLTNQNIASSASVSVKKAAVLSAMNTTITRVNGIFEKDLGVKMVLVANNEDIVFLDAATDNITDGDPDEMINEVQTIIDTEIGTANYDIGHVFSIGGDGIAGLGVVCLPGQKAKGVTGRSSPIGDPYDIDFVVHEIGHQFGATHTQNNGCNRTDSSAVEPGSGSTIMGYAGICQPNVQGQSDDYFHSFSIAQMQQIINTTANCATVTLVGNNVPTANAGADYSIPKSTPFILKGTATDADGANSLTYNWEQIDNDVATMPPLSTNSSGPMFRSLPSKTVPERYIPSLSNVISGTSSTWEVLPSNARDLNFSFLVRDNNAGGGATAYDDMTVTVVDVAPFTVTSQSSAITLDAGNSEIITWNKGDTDLAPINCQNVTIKLSTDGGITFPIILASNTPNDGSESVIIPENVTTSARIMVAAADNIFYNVNAVNFSIRSLTPSFIPSNQSGVLSACNINSDSASYNLNFNFINGFSDTVSLTATGNPPGSLVSFSQTTLNSSGNITMTVSNFNGVSPQQFTLKVTGTSASVSKELDVLLNITSSSLASPVLTTPTSGTTNASITQVLQWQEDINASSYIVELATDLNFSDIIETSTVTSNSYTTTNLNGQTLYFWRVKSLNNCAQSSFSNYHSFITETPSYCSSTFTDEPGGSEYISNVSFGTINNNSSNDMVDGYEDFTSLNTNLLRNETQTISVTFDVAGYQDHCYVFIDWNRDFVFDNNTERYDLGVGTSSTSNIVTLTRAITVPSDARFGKTRMRVVLEYDDPTDGFGDGACDSDHLTEWGETEDYSVTILDPTASIDDETFIDFNLYPNPSNGNFKLSFNVLEKSSISVQLYDLKGSLVQKRYFKNVEYKFSENLEFGPLAKGIYMLKIRTKSKQVTRKILIY